MMESFEQKKEYLNDIVESYLLKDILAVDGIKNSGKMRDLLRSLAIGTKGKKTPAAPKAFANAYPEAGFVAVNINNYLEYI